MASEQTLPADAAVGRVALRVNDLEGVADFYRTVVGLDALRVGDDRATLGAGGTPLLELIADPNARERKPAEAGLFHAAFLVPSRAALGDALGRVESRWELDGASDHLASEALYFADPEDNGIEVYRDRPREEWPIDDDGRVGMETLPLDLDDVRCEARGADGVPPETTVGHVHLEVSSLAVAREFYVGTLGLSVRARYGDSALFLAAGDYHHHVGVNVWNDRSEPGTGRGLAWFELALPDRDALAAVADRLAANGVLTERTDDGLEASDPDGNALRLRVADEPGDTG